MEGRGGAAEGGAGPQRAGAGQQTAHCVAPPLVVVMGHAQMRLLRSCYLRTGQGGGRRQAPPPAECSVTMRTQESESHHGVQPVGSRHLQEDLLPSGELEGFLEVVACDANPEGWREPH